MMLVRGPCVSRLRGQSDQGHPCQGQFFCRTEQGLRLASLVRGSLPKQTCGCSVVEDLGSLCAFWLHRNGQRSVSPCCHRNSLRLWQRDAAGRSGLRPIYVCCSSTCQIEEELLQA